MIEFYNIENFMGSTGSLWHTLLGGLIGALISAGIAWYISKRNIKDQRTLEQERREQDRGDQRIEREELINGELEHFLFLLKRVVNQKIHVAKWDQKYINEYLLNPMGRPILAVENTGDIDRLLILDSKNIRKALKINEKNYIESSDQLYWSLYSALDFYFSHTEQRIKHLLILSKQRDEIGERLVNDIDNLRTSMNEELIGLEAGGIGNHLYKFGSEFRKILDNYGKALNTENSSDMNVHQRLLLGPFLDMVKTDEFLLQNSKILHTEATLLSYLFSRFAANGDDLRKVIEQVNNQLNEQNKITIALIQNHFDPTFLKAEPSNYP